MFRGYFTHLKILYFVDHPGAERDAFECMQWLVKDVLELYFMGSS